MKIKKSSALGCFITLEGIEGAGKSCQISTLESFFKSHNKEVVSTREPGGSELGEAIRALLLSTDYKDVMHGYTELLLIFAARAQHVQQLIKPALSRGAVVICDRFTDSTYAYQGGGRGMDQEKIRLLEKSFLFDTEPDLVFLFDVCAETGLKRASQCGMADRFESEHLDFFQRARDVFLSRAKTDTKRYVMIDAEQDQHAVSEWLLNYLTMNWF